MKRINIIIILTLAFGQLFAQTAEEAFHYANQSFTGTARSSAMGGAFSSLGGDISVASTNPAGLAIYRSSSASFTPGLHISNVKGDGVSGEHTQFIIPSAGIIFASEGNGGRHKGINFGIVYNQGSNFNKHYKLQANNSSYSFLDDVAYEANNPTPYLESALRDYKAGYLPSMAYNTYLISPDATGTYLSPLQKNERMNRLGKYKNSGSTGELAFSIAGNYDNILYWGATLGVENVKFDRVENYSEQIASPTATTTLDKFYYDSSVKTTGTGVNLKLGVIVRPVDNLRLGIAAHTPTFYTLEDEYFYIMESAFLAEPEAGKGLDFRQSFPTDNKVGVFQYQYRTPWKFTFGGSYIFSNIGLLSIDYELTDFSKSKFTDGDFDAVNKDIKDFYTLAGNLKIGAEVRLSKEFSLRGGYNYFGDVYSKAAGQEQKASQYSGGLGYRNKNVFVDCSYQYYTQENSFLNSNQKVQSQQDYNVSRVKLTVGYNF